MNLQPINWKTKIPLVVDDEGNLFYSTKQMENKTYCDIVKDGLPFNWDQIDEKINKDYLESHGIPFEIIIEQDQDELLEYDIIRENQIKNSHIILPEKYEDIIDQLHIITKNHDVLNQIKRHTKDFKLSLKQGLRSRKPHHKQRYSKTQNSKSKYFERKNKILDIEYYKDPDLVAFDRDDIDYDAMINDGYSSYGDDEHIIDFDEGTSEFSSNLLDYDIDYFNSDDDVPCMVYDKNGKLSINFGQIDYMGHKIHKFYNRIPLQFIPYNCNCNDDDNCNSYELCDKCDNAYCYSSGRCC